MSPTANPTPSPSPGRGPRRHQDNGHLLGPNTDKSDRTYLPSPSPSAASKNHAVTDSQPESRGRARPARSAHFEDEQEPDTTASSSSQPQPSHKPQPTRANHSRPQEPTDYPDQHYPRLSLPVEVMRHSYDTIVIGSGYGAGVTASRLSRAGKHVCLLERGKERWPGEYPVSAEDTMKNFHVSGEFAPKMWPGIEVDGGGDPSGMFRMVLGRGQHAVVGNGLGGTSLMNANVFLPADKQSLSMSMWPEAIRNYPEELDKYYSRANQVLQPTPYPLSWPTLPKLSMLERQASALNLSNKFTRPPQTTRFNNGPNSAGVEMKPSTLTGQDCTGINDGSKNTTLVTYIADAWNWGAEMFCECEVRHIEKAPAYRGGWIVYFAWHGHNRGKFKDNLLGDLMWVHARDAVFFGAGTLGTTEILLRSKALGLGMSDLVGKNMSGNGDIVAFGYNTDETVNGVGCPVPSPYSPVGPCITGIIDNREGHANPLDGYVIQEGSIPSALAPFMQTLLDLLPHAVDAGSDDNDKKGKQVAAKGLFRRSQAALERYGSRFLGPYFKDGAMEKTCVYLIMSHDSNQAVLTLKDDKPSLEFLGVGRSQHVQHLNSILEKATQAVGGTLVHHPFYSLFGEQQVTVHPIGGCSMARDGTATTGVTNDSGEVFVAPDSSGATYDGLIVTDGALVPAALGVNPFATITALAERVIQKYCDKHHLDIDWTPNGLLDLFGKPACAPDWSESYRARTTRLSPDSDRGRGVPSREEAERYLKKAQADLVRFEDEDVKIQAVSSLITKADQAQEAGFGFTEVMSGFLHPEPAATFPSSSPTSSPDSRTIRDDKALYELTHRTAKAACSSARFFLSMQTFSTHTTVTLPTHSALLTGTFSCPTIPGSPFLIHRGDFSLFTSSTQAAGTRTMSYDFPMTGTGGEELHFHGYKTVDSNVALDPMSFWSATTTLYVTVTRPSTSTASGILMSALQRKEEHEARCGCAQPWRHNTLLARGILKIALRDFGSQLLTMSPTGTSLMSKVFSTTSFLTYFLRQSMPLFLVPLAPLQYPSQSYRGYINHTPPTHTIPITAADGVVTKLLVWEPTTQPLDPRTGRPVPVENLFMIPGAAVDHQIFALPTIPYNAVNYFRRAGYRVFVTVHRIGQIVGARNGWTTFDTRLDIKGCLEWIREFYCDYDDEMNGYPHPNGHPSTESNTSGSLSGETSGETSGESGNSRKASNGRKKKRIYTIAHCMGSLAFSAGLLSGDIPSSWLLGVTCSQTFMNPIWTPQNLIKIKLGPLPADTLYRSVAGEWFPCVAVPPSTSTPSTSLTLPASSRISSLISTASSAASFAASTAFSAASTLASLSGIVSPSSSPVQSSLTQTVLDNLLRFFPQPTAELCNSPTCHRTTLVFGRCWNHSNLNAQTHAQLDRFFGGVNLTLLSLLMKQGSEGHVMSNEPEARALDGEENVRRFLSGRALRGRDEDGNWKDGGGRVGLGGDEEEEEFQPKTALPFLLFVGGDNAVLSGEATERTYETLIRVFGRDGLGGRDDSGSDEKDGSKGRKEGPIQYRRRVLPGYGHLDCWMGRNAWKDVYPFVREEVDRVVRGDDFRFVEPEDEWKRMVDIGELLY